MNFSEGYGYTKMGLGVTSDTYGAWQKGEMYEADALAYERNSLAETQRNKDSFTWQEHAKDRADFGGKVAMDAYLWSGRQKLNSIENALNESNSALMMQQSIAYEQSMAVDETVGNMMTRDAIDAMKAEARLVAGAAGSGTSGGTTEASTYDAESVMHFDNAVIAGRAAGQKLDIQRRLSMERVSAKNRKLNIASEMSTVMGVRGAGAAYQQGYTDTFAGLSKSEREGYISHDLVQAEDTSTWFDDVMAVKDVIVNSGLDYAASKFFGEIDMSGCNGNQACIDEMKLEANTIYAQGKGVSPATSPVAPIYG